MDRLVENGMLEELSCGVNFSYILKDKSIFSSTEYKVLHSQSGGAFVPCMKMLYNGRIQLYYMVSELKPLAAIVGRLDSAAFLTVVRNLLSDVIAVRTNGFLSCQNVVISFDRIFVNPENLKVSLVYVPVSKRLFNDYSACEHYLRSHLTQMIKVMDYTSEGVMRLAEDLCNHNISLDEIYERLRGRASIKTNRNSAYGNNGNVDGISKGEKLRANFLRKAEESVEIISTIRRSGALSADKASAKAESVDGSSSLFGFSPAPDMESAFEGNPNSGGHRPATHKEGK